MTIEIAFLITMAAIWFIGTWLGHEANKGHRPRYEGFQKFSRCAGDFAIQDGHSYNTARQSHPNRHVCVR